MQYIKQLLQFQTHQHQLSDESSEQSGEFQIIDCELIKCGEADKANQFAKYSVSRNYTSDKITESNSSKLRKENQHIQQQERTANQLQILNQKLSRQYIIIEMDEDYPKDQHSKSDSGASTIKIDEYYLIVSTQEVTKKFTSRQQWEGFYKKMKNHHLEIAQEMSNSGSASLGNSPCDKVETRISLNIKQLNSILQIRSSEIQPRQSYWNQLAVPIPNTRFKHTQLSNKHDPIKLRINVSKLMSTLAPSLLFQIVARKHKQIRNVEGELQRWKAYIVRVLTLYGANDKQIGYSKGLQFIALGILVAKPVAEGRVGSWEAEASAVCTVEEYSEVGSLGFCQEQTSQEYKQFQTHFKYLLFTKQLRNMYFPGTPKLYHQIQLLAQLMISQVPVIYQRLQQMKVDLIKLFINYYKTFLMYRLKNPEVIRKVMELLIVYGINIVRVLLTRIMNINLGKIMWMMGEEIRVLRYLAEELVRDYFGSGDIDEIISKFKQLFMLEIAK